jgi:quercetin dioxygenase-like cupin family protein
MTTGEVFSPKKMAKSEYTPNKGVFFAGMLGKGRGDGFGFYYGEIEPGCEIAREIHPETSETVYILRGEAVGIVEDRHLPLRQGDVLHVPMNTHHGLKNVGDGVLEILVVGHPDF